MPRFRVLLHPGILQEGAAVESERYPWHRDRAARRRGNAQADEALEKMSDSSFQLTCETDFWIKKLSRSVYSDFVNYGTISKGVLESISCLTMEQQKSIIAEAIEKKEEFQIMVSQATDILLVKKD